MELTSLAVLFLVFLIVVRLGVSALDKKVAGQATRIARLERKVDAILKHLGVDFVEEVDPKVLELVIAGRKIEAIKAYREQTGVGLKEAKDYVESL